MRLSLPPLARTSLRKRIELMWCLWPASALCWNEVRLYTYKEKAAVTYSACQKSTARSTPTSIVLLVPELIILLASNWRLDTGVV